MGGKSKSNSSQSQQNVSSNQGVNSSAGINYGVNQSGNFGVNQGSSSSSGGSQSSGSSFGASSQDVWGQQSPFLADVYSQAQNAFGQGMSDINALTPEVQQQMAQAFGVGSGAFQNQANGGNLSGMMGNGLSQGMVGNSASQQLLNSYGDNPYLAGMKGQIADDANLLKQQNLGSLDARAAAAGMSGSSGYRDQTGKMMKDVDKNALNQMTQLGYDSSKQSMQDKMALSQNADSFNMNAANAADRFNMGIGQGMDQSQQGAMNNMMAQQQALMNLYNPSMVGMNMVGQYGNIIGGPTVLGSSVNGSQNNSSSYNNSQSNNSSINTGFSNGMNVGLNQSGGFNNGYGYGAGNGTSSSSSWNVDGQTMGALAGAAMASDIRLKENLRLVDRVDGVNLYEWDWRKDAPVTSPMSYGVIAQEVARAHPDSVSVGEHGYLMVDYSKLGRAGEMALARMGV